MTKKPLSRWKWTLPTFGRSGSNHLPSCLHCAPAVRTNNRNDQTLCGAHVVLIVSILSLCLPPSPEGFPPCWGGPVFNPLLFFEVCPTLSSVSLFAFSTSIFPPLPILSSFTSLFFSACPPSSLSSPFPLLLSPLRLPCHALLSTSPLILSPPLLFLLLTPCSCPAHCDAVYPCITVTTLPAPAVKLFLGELTCEWRALLRRKEKSADRVMEKQVLSP